MDEYGTVTWSEDRATVHFERWVDAAIDTVWEAISTDEGLEKWLAPAKVDLVPGGEINIDFGEEGLAGGAIIELVPGQVLEYNWGFPGEPDSILRIELQPHEGGTRLLLNHRLLPSDQAVGYGAGWHAHIDQLVQVVTGAEVRDWFERFSELLPSYQGTD